MEYFPSHELVCPHVYKKWGERALMFADKRLLDWLTWFRDTLGKPVIINTYGEGGHLTQRGYRCNLCQMVKDKTFANDMYLSAHTRFQAIDFNVPDMLDEEIRQWLDRHRGEMPCAIRIEKNTVGWVHVDVATDNFNKITYFNG
jgi:hypothetical protein